MEETSDDKKTTNKKSININTVVLTVLSCCTIILLLLLIISVIADTDFGLYKPNEIDINKEIICFVAPAYDEGSWSAIKKGFFDVAEDYGFFGLWISASGEEIGQMKDAVDTAISGNADAIIINPYFLDSIEPTMRECEQKGIPVMVIQDDTSGENSKLGYVGIDGVYTNAKILKELKAMGQEVRNIGVVINTHYSGNEEAVITTLIDQIQAEGNEVNVIDFANTNGVESLIRMLTEPTEIDTLIIVDEGSAFECGSILYNYQPEQQVNTIVFGCNDDKYIEMVEMGIIDILVLPDYYRIGYLAGEFTIQSLKGQVIPKAHNLVSRVVTLEQLEIP